MNQTDYLYNRSLFRVDGLPNVEHVLRVDIQMPGVLLVRLFRNRVGGSKMDFLFSSITSFIPKRLSTWKLLQTKADPREHHVLSFFSAGRDDINVGSANIGAIVGGVLSGVVVLVVASTSYYCLKHRRKGEQGQDGPAGTNLSVIPQHIQPFHHNVHSGTAVSLKVRSGTLSSTLGTSPVPPWQGGLHSSSDMNQDILSSADESPEHGPMSRRYSPQSLPPPYSRNEG
jgi:hypothetical protein